MVTNWQITTLEARCVQCAAAISARKLGHYQSRMGHFLIGLFKHHELRYEGSRRRKPPQNRTKEALIANGVSCARISMLLGRENIPDIKVDHMPTLGRDMRTLFDHLRASGYLMTPERILAGALYSGSHFIRKVFGDDLERKRSRIMGMIGIKEPSKPSHPSLPGLRAHAADTVMSCSNPDLDIHESAEGGFCLRYIGDDDFYTLLHVYSDDGRNLNISIKKEWQPEPDPDTPYMGYYHYASAKGVLAAEVKPVLSAFCWSLSEREIQHATLLEKLSVNVHDTSKPSIVSR